MGEKLTPEQKAVEELIVTERGKVRGFLHSVLFIRILWLSLLLLCSPALLLPPHCRLLLSWYLGACLTRTWILLLPSPSLSLKCLCAMETYFHTFESSYISCEELLPWPPLHLRWQNFQNQKEKTFCLTCWRNCFFGAIESSWFSLFSYHFLI